MYTLFADTDMDITPEVAGEYGYKLISMPYAIDGKTFFPYEDDEKIDLHEFYDSLRNGTLPVTSGISKEKYISYFRPDFEKGNDILYVHFSRKMSCTFDAMDEAIAELKKEFPERKFYAVDTKGITIVSYNIAKEIGDMYLAGKSADEIVVWANTEVNRFSQYFFADDLKFFKRSGRVGGVSATMGTLLGIRPIIYMDADGKMVSIAKARGRQKAIEALISYIDELGEDVAAHRIIIGHTDAPEIAAELKKMIEAKYGEGLRIETIVTNPTSGSHCGPNGVGVSFHSKHR